MKTLPLARARRDLRRAVLARRRTLAAVFAALAVTTGLSVLRPAPPPRIEVLVAAHDLAAGARLLEDDVTTADYPPDAVPDGAIDATAPAVGRTLAAPVRAGEPLTDVRLVQPSLLSGYPPDHVLTLIRLADPAASNLVRVGDRVDVLAARPDAGMQAELVATDAIVASVTAADESAGQAQSGPGLVLAVPEEVALDLTAAAATAPLAVVLTG